MENHERRDSAQSRLHAARQQEGRPGVYRAVHACVPEIDRQAMYLRQPRFRYPTALYDGPDLRLDEEARSTDGISDLPRGATRLGRHDQEGRFDGRGIDRAMAGLQRISD